MDIKEEDVLSSMIDESSVTPLQSSKPLNEDICQCPTDISTIDFFKDYIKKIDESLDAMENSCQNIINGVGSIYDSQSIYGHLKNFETAFSQMAEMSLTCENARKIAEPLIEKNEKNPIINMVEVADTNFLDNIYQNNPQYYQYLRTKFYKVWPEVDHFAEEEEY
uniref:Uncharacterized protein n=1 Tax=Panagrolaimus sp. PS1159 TaxID=55785 RepID=A0AC35G2T8_9BILA